jgi:hypothetical protein
MILQFLFEFIWIKSYNKKMNWDQICHVLLLSRSCPSLGQLNSLLLWEKNELKNLTFDFSFCLNFYFYILNIKYKIIFDICTLKAFQWYKEHLIWIKLISCIFFTNIQEVAPHEKLLPNLIPLSLWGESCSLERKGLPFYLLLLNENSSLSI